MIRRASEELGLEPARSYVVGDQAIDMELAARFGATGVWICNSAKAQRTSQAESLAWRGICGTPRSGSRSALKGKSIQRSQF